MVMISEEPPARNTRYIIVPGPKTNHKHRHHAEHYEHLTEEVHQKPRRIKQAVLHRRNQEHVPEQEYRIYKHSLYEDERRDFPHPTVSIPKYEKHTKDKHGNLRYGEREETDDSPEEELHASRYYAPEYSRGHRVKNSLDNYKKHRHSKLNKLYSSATDLRDDPKFYLHGDRHQFKHHFREPQNYNYQFETKSEHDNFLGERKPVSYRDFVNSDNFYRYHDIADESRIPNTSYRGDYGDGCAPNKTTLNQHPVLQTQYQNKRFNRFCCKQPEVCSSRHCNSSTDVEFPPKKRDSLKEVIEKLKSEFVITPKQNDSILEKAIVKDGKGVYVYVPLPEEKDPRKVAKHLDSIYKNIYSVDNKETETARRRRELKKILDKYSFPERNTDFRDYTSTRTTEEKILCETFFKRCEQEGIHPRTTFNTDKTNDSVTDILEDIAHLSPHESNSEFLVKFESKLRRAVRNQEEKNCTCPSTTGGYWSRSDDQLDPYIKELVGALRRR
ncbi:hypothetical protein J6590_063253 [Homalodisca vitripennis]|nr:hypothetical protein J6590_063253 [Homalodisca vitripennis]